MARVLVVDDDVEIVDLLTAFLTGRGHAVVSALNGARALELVDQESLDVALLDLHLTDTDGITLLENIRAKDADLPVIILTGNVEIPNAVKAMKLGASDYLTKPCRNDEILISVEQALRDSTLKREVQVLRQRLDREAPAEDFIGGSDAVKRLLEEVDKIAPTDLTVVLQGESGTGKELIARRIHRKSERREKDFVAVDCGALTETLAESELFGHEKGSFTGAHQRKLGLFELALGGTLLLDEVVNLSYAVQAKLLRAIQERRIRRVGGHKDVDIDVRVIAASNLDLRGEVKKGRFREDLFHRLNQFSMVLPPLRERAEDVPALCEHFLKDANRTLRKNVTSVSPEALAALRQYGWPGNVRELKNIMTRAALLAEDVIEPRHLGLEPSAGTPPAATAPKGRALKDAVRTSTTGAEKSMILDALKRSGGNKAKAAKQLGITRMTLYLKLKKYRLTSV